LNLLNHFLLDLHLLEYLQFLHLQLHLLLQLIVGMATPFAPGFPCPGVPVPNPGTKPPAPPPLPPGPPGAAGKPPPPPPPVDVIFESTEFDPGDPLPPGSGAGVETPAPPAPTVIEYDPAAYF
jgi:hypothetical protein